MLVLLRVCGGAFFVALALALSMPTGAATMHTSGSLVEYNDQSPSTMAVAAAKTFLSDSSSAF
jgi:hypothetical protein